MEEVQTWRELLCKIINDPTEKQLIAGSLHVHPNTLTRWATGQSNPRVDYLRALLESFPHYREQFIPLLIAAFPDFRADNTQPQEALPLEIPSTFYGRVLNAHTTSPPILRASTVCILILQQIIAQFDPEGQGIAALVAQCVPPKLGERKVRSLRITLGRGTPPWRSHLENQSQFFGAESQAGQALTLGRYIAVHNLAARERLFPIPQFLLEESSIAYPILQAERTSGCLCVASTRSNTFSQERLDLLRSYVDLMTLAFEPGEFYALSDIELGIMPTADIQKPLLATFQRRVAQYIIQANQENRSLSRVNVERRVWKELEGELLLL